MSKNHKVESQVPHLSLIMINSKICALTEVQELKYFHRKIKKKKQIFCAVPEDIAKMIRFSSNSKISA